MTKNQQRALLCNRIQSILGVNARRVAEQCEVSLGVAADVLIKLLDHVELAYGRARPTGNTRQYANGAVGHELRCVCCKGAFWVTGVPSSLCIDCDDGNNPFDGFVTHSDVDRSDQLDVIFIHEVQYDGDPEWNLESPRLTVKTVNEACLDLAISEVLSMKGAS